ncbi:hypothetical protein MA16_Dca018826 [Dendrobium catenatum]|uniref:Glycosyltransferase 61 catalytic domain-containing protein n=1 Tax=Dendrobium catenatum TaxID=906689 RepID=A0A2I0X422_9ASPA|nr:hypothetical protein MA16_Dca018826 [Dendrobium catenatum]
MKKLKSNMWCFDRTVMPKRSSELCRLWPAIAMLCCLVLPSIYYISFYYRLSFLNFEPSVRLNLQKEVVNDRKDGIAETENLQQPTNKVAEEEALKEDFDSNRKKILQWQPTKTDEEVQIEEYLTNSTESGKASSNTTLFCDTTHDRYNACLLTGDIRILSNSSKILFFSSSSSSTTNTTWKIKPYPRKWEAPLMERIKELSISSYISHPETSTPLCTINHSTPGVIFSSGGFSGNFFHDLSDILIPLYVTSHHFHGEVKFLVSDFNSKFISKYQSMLTRLSRYELINLDNDSNVHCFNEVQVGTVNNKELGIDTTKPPFGSSMESFRDLLRSSFSLKKKSITKNSNKKPKLLIQLRKGSRELVNSKEVISMARRLGFKVIVSGPEETKNITSYSATVNSVDALLGVHGAGLTNMVFLPERAAMIQIIPWGDLTWACRFSYGQPAIDMGLKYFEYEIKKEESTLIEQYPSDHLVFTNPGEIHKQGWNMLWYYFLEKQKVKVDVKRLRSVLAEVLMYLK